MTQREKGIASALLLALIVIAFSAVAIVAIVVTGSLWGLVALIPVMKMKVDFGEEEKNEKESM